MIKIIIVDVVGNDALHEEDNSSFSFNWFGKYDLLRGGFVVVVTTSAAAVVAIILSDAPVVTIVLSFVTVVAPVVVVKLLQFWSHCTHVASDVAFPSTRLCYVACSFCR